MPFAAFDRIRVINLPHRTDRRRDMEDQLGRAGLRGDPRVQFFSAHRFPDRGRFYSAGARGCYSSHMTALAEARDAGESILLLEDDCDFTHAAGSFALPERWDILYGGYHILPGGPQTPEEGNLIGTHCMGFSAAVLHRLVPWLEAAWAGDDPAPIDGEYVRFRRANPDVVTVFAKPQLGVQRPSASDIGTRWRDRLPVVRHVLAGARKLRHSSLAS